MLKHEADDTTLKQFLSYVSGWVGWNAGLPELIRAWSEFRSINGLDDSVRFTYQVHNRYRELRDSARMSITWDNGVV